MDILQNNKPGEQLQKRIDLDYWSQLILWAYIFTMPFVSAFAFTGTISLPLIFAVALFFLMILRLLQIGKLPVGFLGMDIIIICLFLFLVIFSFLINGWGNSKSLNHAVAYVTTLLIFYAGIKFTLFSISDKKFVVKKVLQFITYTTLISAAFAAFEFASSNFFGLNINNYIPRPSESEAWYDATVLALYYRARGFAPESGHFTFMMELFSPLVIYYFYFSGLCKWSRFLKGLSVFIIILSFIFALSTASFVIIPVAFLFASLIYARKIFLYVKRYFLKFMLTTTIISAIILLLNYFFSFYTLIFLSITEKIDSDSFYDRQAKINFFYDNFSRFGLIRKLIGAGPAGYILLGFDESNSILSLYHSITFELGFLGLFLIILLFAYVIVEALGIKNRIGFFLLVSLISGVMHFYIIANFWYPWFWFIAAFTVFYNTLKRFQTL
jgi:hypothetical protein